MRRTGHHSVASVRNAMTSDDPIWAPAENALGRSIRASESANSVLLMTTVYEDVLRAFILGSIDEFERELIKSRTSEGRASAKLRGVRFGRKPALMQFQREEAIARREAGETLA